jgi:hypothetical protein
MSDLDCQCQFHNLVKDFFPFLVCFCYHQVKARAFERRARICFFLILSAARLLKVRT